MIDLMLVLPVRAYRDALVAVLEAESGLRLVCQASTAAEALARLTPHEPAVALLDFGTADVLPLLCAIRRAAPATHLVGIGVGHDRPHAEAVVRAAEAGVAGFVDADQPLPDVVTAVRLAVRGESSCSPRIAALLLQAMRRRPAPPAMPAGLPGPSRLAPDAAGTRLTPRERLVAELAARGLTNRQISAHLVVGESTVKTHIHAILRELQLRRREEIVLSLDLGLAPGAAQSGLAFTPAPALALRGATRTRPLRDLLGDRTVADLAATDITALTTAAELSGADPAAATHLHEVARLVTRLLT
ncbi:LuxR C-terminal-related transcriptional regulator [Streptomyces sp. NPDC096132]|uniref:LuxR C-terminal-related transcriptional regulator n=1 Tax=Streptomyces sp. NPDC096132 TaxID=3366075 RepID=UPI003810ACE1